MSRRLSGGRLAARGLGILAVLLPALAGAQCVAPPPGLVSWWQGEGNANDQTGANPGFLQGGVAFAPGVVGQAFSFDGVNDVVVAGRCPDLNPATLTLEAWIYMPTLPTATKVLIGKQLNGPGNASYGLVYRTSPSRVGFTITNTTLADYIVTSTSVVAGAWQHWAGTYDGVNLKLYLNGVLQGSQALGITIAHSNAYPLRIGAWDFGIAFQGLIDEVGLFNRALTVSEIASIVSAGSAGMCPITPPPPPPVTTWNATTDYSECRNPNGAWTYGWTTTLGSAFNTYAYTISGPGCPIVYWQQPGIGALNIDKNWSTSPVTCATWTMPPQSLGMHPGSNNQHAVLRWTAPRAGPYRIRASFIGIDFAYPTTTDVYVLRNSVPILSGIVNRYGSGPELTTTITLAAGDRIDFSVGANGSYVGDHTGVDVEVLATDSTPPVVTITSPANGTVLAATSVTVLATVSDESATTVVSTPAGISANLPEGGGAVGGTVPLQTEGANLIAVNATDAAGNTGGTSITVIRDTIGPQVTITTPLEGAVLGASPVALTVQVNDATATTVTFGSHSIPLPAGGGAATGDVDLVEGPNTITVTAVDGAGNQTIEVRHVVLDLSAPIVTIESPVDGACFGPGSSTIPVAARVEDSTATTVSSVPAGVSGALPAGGGPVNGTIDLQEGLNPIRVSATDATSRTGEASITVLLDTTPPVVAVVSPATNQPVRGTVDLHATATDVAPGSGIARVELRFDGGLVVERTAPPYETTIDTTLVPDGLHLFEAVAFDGKGNSAASQVTALVDNTPPSITITQPAPGGFVAGTIPFTASASDGGSGLATVVMRAAGVPPSTDGSRSYAPPQASVLVASQEDTTRRPDGPLLLAVRAVDAAGNEAATSVTVTTDNTLPEKSLVAPTDGSVVSGVVELRAVATDVNLSSIELLVDDVPLGSSGTSPFVLPYDTRNRLDGAMTVTAIVRDLAGNRVVCTARVTVDNVAFRLTPRTLNLRSQGGENSVTAHLEGVIVGLLPPEAHGVELRVPGGNPVPATAGPDLPIKFDRQRLIASIRAGISASMIQPNSQVTITLVAEGRFVIGTDTVRIVGD